MQSESRPTREMAFPGQHSPRRPERPRALAVELSILEQHLRALEEDIARLESGLAALGTGVVSDDELWSRGCLEAGELVIEHDARKVYVSDAEIPLSPTEYRCLYALVRNAGRVMTHQYLLRQATGNAVSEPSHLKVYIARLRAKLRAAGASDGLVESVRGIGYRLATSRTSPARPRGTVGGRFSPEVLPRTG